MDFCNSIYLQHSTLDIVNRYPFRPNKDAVHKFFKILDIKEKGVDPDC